MMKETMFRLLSLSVKTFCKTDEKGHSAAPSLRGQCMRDKQSITLERELGWMMSKTLNRPFSQMRSKYPVIKFSAVIP